MADCFDVSDAKGFWEDLRPGVSIDSSCRFRFISADITRTSSWGILEDAQGGMKVVSSKTEAYLIADGIRKQKGAVL